ncbi:hypothetical protein SAMN05216548_10554 [Faunimonas pinastri]|uniref:Uncharacterized protein n=1 Tax=Faunimonas pinastri TaxID=1855383 RepID=A0A1H9GJ49_9HYPH|nr:hypothetical protein [Faunimonas pinastri]SEQ50049.1 hypothetical protein SAMN05216548_10554 [Faunimonas pinastri]
MNAARPVIADRYAPRAIGTAAAWQLGGWRFKNYRLAADGKLDDFTAIEAAARRTAEAVLPELDATAHHGVGFAILHRGEEGIWLLLNWWLSGGICAGLLWRAPVDEPDRWERPDGFERVERPLLACVWELSPIAFERDAWVDTVMNGGSVDDYLARTYSRRTC